MMMMMLGTLGKPLKMKCGGWTGCDEDHEVFDPKQTVTVQDAIKVDEFRACDEWSQAREDKAIRDGLLMLVKDEYIIPTLLGHWLDDTCVN